MLTLTFSDTSSLAKYFPALKELFTTKHNVHTMEEPWVGVSYSQEAI